MLRPLSESECRFMNCRLSNRKLTFRCDAFPEHACLASYPADGNLQFRDDQHRLLPLS